MEVLPENDKCKTWEEEMYWKHFHAMHFYVVLPKDFHDHLVLPSKFAEHMSSKLPNKVSLVGPSGSSWDVEVSKAGSLALVGDGWKDFAESFGLEENFLMMLKYKQNATFEALVFDQKSLCEKESTYFVKKHVLKTTHRSDKKRNVAEAASTELMEENDVGGDSGVRYKKQKTGNAEKGNMNSPEAPRTSPSVATTEESSKDKATDDVIVEIMRSIGNESHRGLKSCVSNKASGQDGGRTSEANKSKAQSSRKPSGDNTSRELVRLSEMEKSPTANGERELFDKVTLTANLSADERNEDSTPETICFRRPVGKRGRPPKQALASSPRKLAFKSATKRFSKEYTSNRRPVTNEEEVDAFRRANAALPDGGFIVVMRPTCVYKRFYMTIPGDWMHQNLPRRHHEIVLRVGEKTWRTMFHYYGQRAHSGGLATGWKSFAIQHNLEDSDVCVFKPASTRTDDGALVLDVEIFRVVPEITPLTPLMCSM